MEMDTVSLNILHDITLDELSTDTETLTCPNCRHSFIPEDPDVIKKGKWILFPKRTYYDNKELKFTPCEAGFLYQVAKSKTPISAFSLGYRISGNNCENLKEIAYVYRCKVNNKLKKSNIESPIKTIFGVGYAWINER